MCSISAGIGPKSGGNFCTEINNKKERSVAVKWGKGRPDKGNDFANPVNDGIGQLLPSYTVFSQSGDSHLVNVNGGNTSRVTLQCEQAASVIQTVNSKCVILASSH